MVYAQDVTNQMEQDAEQQLDKLKLIVEHADQVALGLFDASTRQLLYASPLYMDFLSSNHGYPKDSILGRTWDELAFVPTGEDPAEFFPLGVVEPQRPALRRTARQAP